MARILRGDVVWAELDPTKGNEQAGRRPVLILSQDVFNERSGTVIAAAITSQEPRRTFPLTIELTSPVPKRSWVKISQSFGRCRSFDWASASVGEKRRGGAGDRGPERDPRGITLRAPEREAVLVTRSCFSCAPYQRAAR